MTTNTKRTAALAKVNTTFEETVQRILETYDRATDTQLEDGMQWYPGEGQWVVEVAYAHGFSVDTVAAVAAHLSPRIDWDRCKTLTQIFLSGGGTFGLMKANAARAQSAIDSETPLSTVKGNKTKSFAANLLGDVDAVTVDVWAIRVALGATVRGDEVKIAHLYDALADAYREAALRRGISAPSMQAVTWVVARGRK
jgi:hypothetical protein